MFFFNTDSKLFLALVWILFVTKMKNRLIIKNQYLRFLALKIINVFWSINFNVLKCIIIYTLYVTY